MGKAKIQYHIGAGLYFVSYYRDVEYAEEEVKKLEKLRAEIEESIYKPDGLNDKLVDQANDIDNAGTAFNDKLAQWRECAKTMPPCKDAEKLMTEVLQLGKSKAQAIAAYMKTTAVIAALKSDALAALRRIAFYQNYATDKASEGMEVWCVDYPHEDTGPIPSGTMVGTIETYGGRNVAGKDFLGPDPAINIQVSYGGEAPYSASRDYQIRPLAAQSVATALTNSIEWLGVMAKRPLYETGTLTDKNEANNTGTVELYGNTIVSGAPAVEGVFPKTLTNIPIVYQTCHAKVFDVGDKVIVEYAGYLRDTPKVIGFASNPAECKWFNLTYTCDSGLYLVGETAQLVMRGRDGTPVTVMPSGDTVTFLRWSDHNSTINPRTDTNVQANKTVNAIAYPTPIWPTAVRISTGGGTAYGHSECCYGGTHTDTGNDGWSQTFNGNYNEVPGIMVSIAVGYAITVALEGWIGGDPGIGGFGDTGNDGPGQCIGAEIWSPSAQSYTDDSPGPYPGSYALSCDSVLPNNNLDAEGWTLETSVTVTRDTNGTKATGSSTKVFVSNWGTLISATPPPPFLLTWQAWVGGNFVYMKRWYEADYWDGANREWIMAKAGQWTPP